MEVGFCDGRTGDGFYTTQPADHLERWSLPVDNGTHLIIPWRPERRACGLNVSSYWVDVKTSTPVLNLFIGLFGSFPQDLCDPRGSKARDAVNVVDSGGTCSPYAGGTCSSRLRFTSFDVPASLRQMTKMDVQITVRGYGSLSPVGRPSERTPWVMWCHKYRKARAPLVADPGNGAPRWRRWLSSAWRRAADRRERREPRSSLRSELAAPSNPGQVACAPASAPPSPPRRTPPQTRGWARALCVSPASTGTCCTLLQHLRAPRLPPAPLRPSARPSPQSNRGGPLPDLNGVHTLRASPFSRAHASPAPPPSCRAGVRVAPELVAFARAEARMRASSHDTARARPTS